MPQGRIVASIIVLFELDPDAEIGPDGVEPVVLLVHAAGSDPDVPEDPQGRTLCGLDTSGMEHAHYRAVRPGEPWVSAHAVRQAVSGVRGRAAEL